MGLGDADAFDVRPSARRSTRLGAAAPAGDDRGSDHGRTKRRPEHGQSSSSRARIRTWYSAVSISPRARRDLSSATAGSSFGGTLRRIAHTITPMMRTVVRSGTANAKSIVGPRKPKRSTTWRRQRSGGPGRCQPPDRRAGGQPPTTSTSRGNCVRRSTLPGRRVERDEVLDAHARLALEVDARARPRRPSGSAAASRALPCRGSAPRASRGRSRGPSRGRSAAPWPPASMTARAIASTARPLGRRATVRGAGHGRLERLDGGRLGARHELVDREVAGASARPRTASASCRCGSRPTWAPKSNSRTAPVEHRPVAGRAVRAAPPRVRPGRRRRTRAPRRRRSGSAIRAGAPARPRSRRLGSRAAGSRAPGRRPHRRPRCARARPAPWSARSASTQPSTGTSSTSGAAAASRSQIACGTNAGLHGDPPRADRAGQLRPARRQVAVDVDDAGVRGLPAGLDRVAGVGEDHQVVAADEELPGRARDLLLAVAQGETRSGSACARGGRRSRRRRLRPRSASRSAFESRRPGGSVGLEPGGALAVGRAAAAKSAGSGKPTAHM